MIPLRNLVGVPLGVRMMVLVRDDSDTQPAASTPNLVQGGIHMPRSCLTPKTTRFHIVRLSARSPYWWAGRRIGVRLGDDPELYVFATAQRALDFLRREGVRP